MYHKTMSIVYLLFIFFVSITMQSTTEGHCSDPCTLTTSDL